MKKKKNAGVKKKKRKEAQKKESYVMSLTFSSVHSRERDGENKKMRLCIIYTSKSLVFLYIKASAALSTSASLSV